MMATETPVKLIACETVWSIVHHARIVTPETPVSFTGTKAPCRTLCGMEVGWDLEFDLVPDDVTCRLCLSEVRRLDRKGLIR